MTETKKYLVAGPRDRKWSIWDHGDEMIVCEGPDMLDQVAARVETAIARRLDDAERWAHVVGAASAIHAAKLAGWSTPIFHMLWKAVA